MRGRSFPDPGCPVCGIGVVGRFGEKIEIHPGCRERRNRLRQWERRGWDKYLDYLEHGAERARKRRERAIELGMSREWAELRFKPPQMF